MIINQKAINQLGDLIELVKNPDEYSKRVNTLKELIDSNEKTLKSITKAKDIDSLYKKALKAKTEAEEILENANKTSVDAISGAKEKAEYLTVQARETAQEMLSHADKANKEAIQREKDAKVVSQELKTLQTQLDAANQAQQKRQSDLDKREVEIKRKESILSQLSTSG